MLKDMTPKIRKQAEKFEKNITEEEQVEYDAIFDENQVKLVTKLREIKDGKYIKNTLSFKILTSEPLGLISVEAIIFNVIDLCSIVSNAKRDIENVKVSNLNEGVAQVEIILSDKAN